MTEMLTACTATLSSAVMANVTFMGQARPASPAVECTPTLDHDASACAARAPVPASPALGTGTHREVLQGPNADSTAKPPMPPTATSRGPAVTTERPKCATGRVDRQFQSKVLAGTMRSLKLEQQADHADAYWGPVWVHGSTVAKGSELLLEASDTESFNGTEAGSASVPVGMMAPFCVTVTLGVSVTASSGRGGVVPLDSATWMRSCHSK